MSKRIAAALLGVGLWLAACGAEHQSVVLGEAPVLRAPAATVEAVELERAVDLYGVVEADRTVSVSARVMATVTVVVARTGDRVERGQVLLEIDPQAAQGHLAQARGALAQARAALTLAGRNHQRFEALAATEAASELELDSARMRHEQALGAVEQAEGAVRAAAAVAADAQVRAPFDARVLRRMVEVGDLVAPGRPLVTLESERGRRLAVEVPETLASRARLAVGVAIDVAIDARPELGRLTGEVVEAASGADPRSHTLQVKIALPVDDLPSGGAGRARIPSGVERAVVAPAGAVIERGGIALVVVASDDGRATTRVVTVGAPVAGNGRVEILSGLSGGETVLLGLLAAPPAGAKVEIVPEGAA